MDGDCQDALLHWVNTFFKDRDDIPDTPEVLLDGILIAKVYNELVHEQDQISIPALKVPKDSNDWVSMMMNFRQISGRIIPNVRQNGYDATIDLNELVHKKNRDELFKFLRCFLYFSVKSPNRRLSIQNIRTLDNSYMHSIQVLLKEFAAPAQPRAHDTHAAEPEHKEKAPKDDASQKRIAELDKEIATLRAKKSALDKEIEEAEKNSHSSSSEEDRAEQKLNDAKRRHKETMDKKDKLQRKLDDAEDKLNESRNELDRLREQKNRLMVPATTSATAEKENEELKKKLEELKQQVINDLKADPKVASIIEREPPSDVNDYIKLLGVQELNNQIDVLNRESETMQKALQMKEAEIRCLSKTLEEQNKKSAVTLKKKIASLNAEIDASPIGDAKRLSIKYQRVIKKLEKDIEGLKSSCSDMEFEELHKQLTLMASRKANEGDLLAKKQSFIQTTSEQCDIRLERIKLNVSLHTHAARISKWKNCFIPLNKK